MVDRGGSGKRTYPSGSTFLSVPVSTLTRKNIERKAKREKAAADKRAQKVNEGIEKQNKAILNALYYPRQAERAFETGVTNNSGPRIIQSVKTLLYNPPKNPNANTVKGFNYSYGTGQYSSAGSVKSFVYNNTPHTIRDFARVAAKADTTTDIDVYNWNNKNRIDPRFHHDSISAGETWLADNKAYTDWILSAATDEEANRRIKQAKKYYEQAFHDVPTYDPSTNTYSVQTQIREDTPLPPWIAQTAHNKALWAYYTTYSNEVVASAVQAYNEARDEGREYARTPYKSAFAGSESKGQVDSFLDVAIDAITSSSSFEEFDDKFLEGLYAYGRDYIVNPIRAGKLKTAAGNALWNLMDTMDVASRGVRALVAGETTLGGTGGREFKNANSAFDDYYAKTWEKYGVAPSEEYERNKNHGTWERRNDATFKGQKVYWANIKGHSLEDIQRAQTLFMDHGGYALLLDKHPDFANKAQMAEMTSLSDADRTAIIQELDNIFAGSDINWRDIYKDIDKNYFNQDRVNKGFKQGVKNIKEAYTDVDANFNADTGSMLADIIIETTLDPGTMVGGIAKNAAKKGVSSAAEIAVSEGFKHILMEADDADAILKNKSVRQALNSLISSNEGRNIIFKKADDFENDVDLFIAKLRKAGVFANATMDPAIGAGDDVASAFKKIVTSHLMDKNVSVNGAIIAAQDFARKSIDNKVFKAAYYMDKAIDGIDSAIIKSSFFLPWAGLRGARALGHGIVNTVANSEFLAKALARFNLKKVNATQTLLDDITGEVNVTKVSDLMAQADIGLHNESSVRYALSHVIDQYDDVTWHVNDIIRKFSRGELSEVDALKEIGDHIYQITGGKYRYVRELGGYVDELAIKYAGDIKSAFGRMDDAYSRLLNMIDRRSENAIEGFLDEVRQAQTIDDLTRLFREHMDNEYIMALRREVVENSQLDITVEDVDRLVNQLNMGLFSDKSVTQEIVHTGVKAQSKMAEKTLRRTVSFEQFGKILDDMGIDWKELVISGNIEDSSVSKFEKKLSEFMVAWSKQSYVTYNVDDALKFVDRLYNQIHFKELLDKNVTSEVSALVAHPLTTECAKLRKQIKRLDLVNLKDVKYIILPQLDRMALHQSFINDANIQNLYGGFYDDVIAPLVAEFSKMTSDEIDLMDSSLFKDVDDLAKQKYGFDRTQQLVEEAKTLKGFSDEHLHSFLNTLATDFRFRDLESGEIVLTPGMLRRRVEATLRAQTGHSKVGMKNITDSLQSLNSDNPSEFLKPYWEEMRANPALQARLDRYIQTDVLDPRAYVEKQMLYTVLADPSVITEWNALAAKGQTPIMFHVNTTGLNSEINSMTSVTFRQWVPIEITEQKPLTLERLLDAMDNGETTVIQRGMTDSELNEFTEQVIRQLDIKDCDPSNIMKRYKGYYGVSDTRAYKSEEDMIEEACAYIRATSRQVDDGTGALRSVAPTLVVHDLDGFNVSYFNDKVGTMARATDENTATYDYIHRVSRSAKDNSCNTYTRLAEHAGDLYYTEEQLDDITELLHSYIDDINHFAPDYKMNDMQSYSRKLHDIVKTLNLKKDANELTEQEEAFLDLFQKADGSAMLGAYDNAVKNITDLGLYPRQYAFVSSGLEDNFTKAALEATGRTSVNVNSRLYVDDILSYFNLETEDGFYAPVEDLKQMHAMAQYITRTRNRQIVAGAEEFLAPYKADFDRVIQSVIDIAKGNSYEGIKLAYMQNMRIPDNAIDSYLMAKKLYNDHIKYWLDTDELTSLRTNGKDLDVMKQKLYAKGKELGWDDPRFLLERDRVFKGACAYVNDHRIRMFDEVTGGGFNSLSSSERVLDLLQGAHEPEIYNWAARSDFEKNVLTYRDGVMKYGLDKAAKYSEAGSQIASDMRQLQHMDEYFAAAGILRNSDRFTASVYRKTDQLFKILDNTGFLKRESFHTFMQKAAELQRLQLHEYRFNALKNTDGVFDRDKLLSELVYNGFNMTVFNSHNYSVADMKELREFVQDLKNKGDDFLSYYEDRTTGNVYVYLNDGAQIAEADGARWINQSIRLERPKYGVVPHADFDELAQVLDIDDIEDYRGVYAHLRSCWEDTRLLSLGQINGTTGRTVSRRQADEFIQSLPANMNDWCTSEGLLRDELTRGVIYDPGFVINDQTDMLTDFLGTLQRQAETAKDDCILINEVFHSNGAVHLNDLAEHFSTEELIDYFGENPEYVVCTIVADDRTATGFKVKQINMSNRAGVEIAKNTENTTILPYSTFYDITNYMNRDVGENVQKQLLGKYMLVYKAFALVKPGTWMRNYIDATIKASFNNGGGAGDVVNMLQYEGIAARYIGDYGKILQSDASLLTPANWDIVQQTYKTSMTYEDFELLRGVMDSDRYKSADKYFLSRTARQRQGFNVISGENIGLRNLDRKDITEAFEKYLATETDLPLTRKEFLDIYNGDVIPDEAMKDQFDDMYRRLTNNMRNSNVANIFDKTIDTMFKPFGTVEELVRFAQTMQLRDNGLSLNQIVRNIHNTQFYTAPMQGTWRTLENIVPFITFKFNNMMYWVRMMDENPRLFRYFEDTYRSVYETTLESALQEGVELDYETDYGLQSGGISLGNGQFYFNLGSSFLSAMSDFYGMPHDIDSLNPLIRDSVRASMYALGLNSKEFFSNVDLDITGDDITQKALAMVPGYSLIKTGMRTFKNIEGLSTESGGPNVQALFYLLNGLGAIGVRNQYGKNGDDFSFQEWKKDLEAQGKWYDANLGKVVPLSQKNEYGANDPNASFQDIQAYMLVHFGKLWDANQRKFVPMDEYVPGGYNEALDFENDPEGAWKQLCDYMGQQGKKWDANQRKFVLPKDYIAGGLNAENLEWDTVVALMQEKFPDLIYDANQQTFVEKKYYIAGGLNEFSQYEGQDFLRHWNELKSIRYALYGETYDKASHKFIKTADPTVVTIYDFMDIDTKKQYDNYYNMLGIPRLQVADKPLIVKDGVLMTTDGKYVLTGNTEHDAKVFDRVRNTFGYQGRRYSGHRRYSYNKTRNYNKKPYRGRPTPSTYYSSVGWATHDYEGTDGYKFEFNYQFQYHSPQPASKLHRLITPPIFYPYGGGYNKFSFQARV